MTKLNRLRALARKAPILAACMAFGAQIATAQELYLVNLTAEWCPNCKILDPRLEDAMTRFDDGSVQQVELDFTTQDTMGEAFNRVNGTMTAGVYADYAGLTGLGVLVSADSGETIECLNRTMTADVIELQILAAREIVRTTRIGTRNQGSVFCPPVNARVQ